MQDRLPKELALAGMTTIETANRSICQAYLPEHKRPVRDACRLVSFAPAVPAPNEDLAA